MPGELAEEFGEESGELGIVGDEAEERPKCPRARSNAARGLKKRSHCCSSGDLGSESGSELLAPVLHRGSTDGGWNADICAGEGSISGEADADPEANRPELSASPYTNTTIQELHLLVLKEFLQIKGIILEVSLRDLLMVSCTLDVLLLKSGLREL